MLAYRDGGFGGVEGTDYSAEGFEGREGVEGCEGGDVLADGGEGGGVEDCGGI